MSEASSIKVNIHPREFEIDWVDFESVNQVGRINNYGELKMTIVFVYGNIKTLPDFKKITSRILLYYTRRKLKTIEKESFSRMCQARVNGRDILDVTQ